MDARLNALASAHGVATWYEDTERRRIEVADDVVVAVLAELGVDASSPEPVRAVGPLVVRQGDQPPLPPGVLLLEDGNTREIRDRLPADLPLGWHQFHPDGYKPTTQPTQPTRPTQPTQSTQLTQPTQSTQLTQPTQPTQLTQPTRPTHLTRPTQPTQPTRPSQPHGPTDNIYDKCELGRAGVSEEMREGEGLRAGEGVRAWTGQGVRAGVGEEMREGAGEGLRARACEGMREGMREVVVTPRRLAPVPPSWGWMLQLYALHSPGSWGIGDLADLRDLAAGAARLGAGVLLVNPVQAITPTLPVARSPYSPSSRRFANPLYLRVTETEAFRRADPATRAAVERLAPPGAELIDYDAVWTAKLRALELLWPLAGHQPPMDDDLRDFATFCALAERHGPDWRTWPAGLRRPDSTEVAAARDTLRDRVAFHAWLQRLCQQQLASARAAAAGLAVGIVHDLPVGVDPAGADAWALQDVLASSVTVGAPPDAFSQQGQDWNLPPWRPDRLAAAGYRPFRDVIRAVLAHADGIRVDHVSGLWRLWWIPPGRPASEGTYVHYDSSALLGILALEAHRASAIVVGEDLGTVPAEVTETLHERGMLSSAVLWFQRDDDGRPLPPARWPVDAMASISTHDLPTAAGFLRGEHVQVRAGLGLLADPAAEQARAATERAELLQLLAAHGLLPGAPAAPEATEPPTAGEPTEQDLVAALHALLATAASRLLLTSPPDALGEPRQPNLPGTIDEYPNWRIPLTVTVDQLLADPGVRRAIAALRVARP